MMRLKKNRSPLQPIQQNTRQTPLVTQDIASRECLTTDSNGIPIENNGPLNANEE